MGILVQFLLLLSLAGCLQNANKESSFVSFRITSSLISAPNGLVLYLTNEDLGIRQTHLMDTKQITLDLKKGRWQFVMTGWSTPGMGGVLKCAQASKLLTLEAETVELSFSEANCDSAFFSPRTVNLVSCQDIDPVTTSAPNCTAPITLINSYRIRLPLHSPVPLSGLSKMDILNLRSLDSSCMTSRSTNSSTTIPTIKMPYGSDRFPLPVVVEAFSDATCSTKKSEFYFPRGLVQPTMGGPRGKTLTSTYLEFKPIDVVGLNMGVSVGDQTVTRTLSINKASHVKIMSISQPSAGTASQVPLSPFQIVSVSCPVEPNLPCTFLMSFTPISSGSQSSNLSVTYTEDGVTQSVETFVLKGSSVKGFTPIITAPAVVNGGFEDSTGMRYIGTNAGLLMNGSSDSTFLNKTTFDGLPSDVVNFVYVYDTPDKKYVYAGTADGLGFSSNNILPFSNVVLSGDVSGLSQIVNDVHVTSEPIPRIIAATNDTGIGYNYIGYNYNINQIPFFYTTFNGLWSNNIGKVFGDSQGNIYGTYLSTLHRKYYVKISPPNPQSTTPTIDNVQIVPNNPELVVNNIYAHVNGDVYISTSQGLYKRPSGTAEHTLISPVTNVNDVAVLNMGPDTYVYIATNLGLIIRNETSKISNVLTTEHGLPSIVVNHVQVRANGDIFVGTELGFATSRPPNVLY